MTTTALVTGATRGLGLRTTTELAAAGWTVYLGSRDLDAGKAVAAGLPGDIRPIQLDVTSDDSVAAAVAAVTADAGVLDVLVNNAGIVGARTAPLETGPADFLAAYGTNVLGPVRVTRAFLPLLGRSAHPRIVMVSSGMGSIGRTTDPTRLESGLVTLVYPSSKAALNMLTTMYAKALPAFKVNAVDPGYTATDFNDHRGVQTIEEGTRAILATAMAGPDGPTGGFFDKDGPVPW